MWARRQQHKGSRNSRKGSRRQHQQRQPQINSLLEFGSRSYKQTRLTNRVSAQKLQTKSVQARTSLRYSGLSLKKHELTEHDCGSGESYLVITV
eukprot:COSAG01_NODE_1096_length_11713_cov_213.007060_13_plen_94_part_00